jgi:poly-beta-1,6-N-acetyl-D-glucosamine synthase
MTRGMFMDLLLYTVFVTLLVYFLTMIAYYAFQVAISWAQSNNRRNEIKREDKLLLASSHFSIPVSIIMPARNEEKYIENSVLAVLKLDYPEFELIVSNDGSTDGTLDILYEILDLRPLDKVYEQNYTDGKIQEVLMSVKYPGVTVINKTSGNKKAGALNAALNFVRYKYVCVLDADTILEPDALIKVMMQVEKNPEEIAGVGSYFGLFNGFRIEKGEILKKSFTWNPLLAFQNLEYIRSFIGQRLTWSAFDAIPIISGGFALWRRDILQHLGGFDINYTCEDMEMTFRIKDHAVKTGKKYRVISLPYNVAWTEGPSNIKSLILQRNRWQRVVNETVVSYSHMIFNPSFGMFGMFTMPYMAFYEAAGVIFEFFSIAVVLISWIAGILNFYTFLAYLLFMVMAHVLISLLVLFAFVRDHTVFSAPYVAYMVLLSFLDFFVYRWILFLGRMGGMIDFFRRKKTFDQYKRQ